MNTGWQSRLPDLARGFGIVSLVVLAFLVGDHCAGAPTHKAEATAGEAPEQAAATQWTCSMHPQIKLTEPGDCPICGMDLIPLTKGDGPTTPGKVSLSPEAREMARIRTTTVSRGRANVELRLLGKLEHDERRVRSVTAWIGGRVERLHVSEIGARIHSGQTIATLYSPDVYAAQQDLIQARRQLKALKDGLPIARSAAKATVNSAKTRLSLLGLSDKTVRKMGREKKPRRTVALTSPHGGTVLEQKVQQGDYVTVGQPLFEIASLRRLWVQLDAYETDLPRIHTGQKVLLRVPSLPGEVFEGEVAFVDPVIDPSTRAARVRIEVPNKKRRLRPGLLAEAVLLTEKDTATEGPLMVPRTAPLFTGKRAIVYVEDVAAERPTYEAREVQLGVLAGSLYPVLKGLREGEKVVTEGAFTLDAELQIHGGASMMQHPDDLTRGRTEPQSLPPGARAVLAELMNSYLVVQQALSADQLGPAVSAAKALSPITKKKALLTDQASASWQTLTARIHGGATAVTKSDDLDGARKAFLELSKAVLDLVAHFGNPRDSELRIAFCPMADDGRGARWLQTAEQVENPYFGSKMYRCGEIKNVLTPGQAPQKPNKSGAPKPGAPKAPAPSHAGHAGHQH